MTDFKLTFDGFQIDGISVDPWEVERYVNKLMESNEELKKENEQLKKENEYLNAQLDLIDAMTNAVNSMVR